MGKRYIAPKVIKELYARSGNCCAFSGCNSSLFEDANLSEVCHIEGLNPDSARYNPSLSEEEVNSMENLILLCSNHHSLVDQREEIYTVDILHQMKYEHESRVSQLMDDSNHKEFYLRLQKIFQECKFDVILLQQSFDAPFADSFFDMVGEGYLRIRDLLNEDCSLALSGQERQELYGFIQLAESVMTGVAMNSHSNGNGFAIPRYNPQDLIATQENVKSLQSTYSKYRFR